MSQLCWHGGGLGRAPEAQVLLGKLEPGEDLFPRADIRRDEYPQRYARLWQDFQADCQTVFQIGQPPIFCEALLSLSERYLFAVPSSTKDQPDVCLHDHSRSAAALGAALYQWHRQDGSLQDPVRIRDRKTAKFRIVTGDLSGIQSSLFLLASQRVKGVNRILRARSFLMGMLLEGALMRCREELNLPVFSVLQNAGGRFLLLAANTAETESAVGRVREEVERWLYARYLGELALNLAVTEPFSGEDLMQRQFPRILDRISRAAETAKLRAFSTCLEPAHRNAFPLGPCGACGVRPARHSSRDEDGEEIHRCAACEDEARLGGGLPRTGFLAWSRQPAEGPHLELFGGLRLHWLEEAPFSLTPFVSVMRLYRGAATPGGPLPLRFVANYVARFRDGEPADPRYAGLGAAAPGDLKTFEHLARDAWIATDSGFAGEDHLAVIKADVDRLGTVFSEGIPQPSLGAFASLSRMMDFFFTGQLPHLLEREFPSTYTVYAGGDDLLLIGPWRQALDLVARLRAQFGDWTAGNANVTLSAAVELIKANHPLNRAVWAAEERLASAKGAGRNRVSAIDARSLAWSDFAGQVSRGKELAERLLAGEFTLGFVHQILYFARQRLRARPRRTARARPPGGYLARAVGIPGGPASGPARTAGPGEVCQSTARAGRRAAEGGPVCAAAYCHHPGFVFRPQVTGKEITGVSYTGGRPSGGPGRGSEAPPQVPSPRTVKYFEGGVLNAELLDKEAEEVARQLRGVAPSQLRRFYEDVLSLSRRLTLEAERSGNEARKQAFERLRPEFKMLKAKAVYTFGRADNKSKRDFQPLMQFFVDHVAAVKSVEDFDAFCKHFQAVVAFHKFLGASRGR